MSERVLGDWLWVLGFGVCASVFLLWRGSLSVACKNRICSSGSSNALGIGWFFALVAIDKGI